MDLRALVRSSLGDGRVTKAALPWLAILLVFLILITYVPILSTWLPDLAFGKDLFPNDQQMVDGCETGASRYLVISVVPVCAGIVQPAAWCVCVRRYRR